MLLGDSFSSYHRVQNQQSRITFITLWIVLIVRTIRLCSTLYIIQLRPQPIHDALQERPRLLRRRMALLDHVRERALPVRHLRTHAALLQARDGCATLVR